jgi:hypothetical protein
MYDVITARLTSPGFVLTQLELLLEREPYVTADDVNAAEGDPATRYEIKIRLISN